MRVESLSAAPLEVPLRDPFVIASGRIDRTRAALVTARVIDDDGERATGLGEAAALPPVTREDLPDILASLQAARPRIEGARVARVEDLGPLLDECFPAAPVARAAVECALLDAMARIEGAPVSALLGSGEESTFVTDVTIPIASPDEMARRAAGWRAQGFTRFKVKVGRDRHEDAAALLAVAARVPDAAFRLDANAGFSAKDALALLSDLEARGLVVECFEQPCGKDDLDGMAEVTRAARVPVVADESVATVKDLLRAWEHKALTGVNLKLVKAGGLLEAFQVGAKAKELGLVVMCGGMVETRLGLSAMGQVARALSGVDLYDLDTAFLLAEDPFQGGYAADGPTLTLAPGPGLAVSIR